MRRNGSRQRTQSRVVCCFSACIFCADDDIDGFSASVFLQDVQTKHTVLDVNKSLVFRDQRMNHEQKQNDHFSNSSPLFVPSQDDDEEDFKMKPEIRTVYDGFTIYGKTLWLVVSSTIDGEHGQNFQLEDWAASNWENTT